MRSGRTHARTVLVRWLCHGAYVFVCVLLFGCSGLPPKHERPTPQLSREDMKVALQRGGTERDEYDAGERVEGLGLAPYVLQRVVQRDPCSMCAGAMTPPADRRQLVVRRRVKSVGPEGASGLSHRVVARALSEGLEDAGAGGGADPREAPVHLGGAGVVGRGAGAGSSSDSSDDGRGKRKKSDKKHKKKKKKDKKKKKHKHKKKHSRGAAEVSADAGGGEADSAPCVTHASLLRAPRTHVSRSCIVRFPLVYRHAARSMATSAPPPLPPRRRLSPSPSPPRRSDRDARRSSRYRSRSRSPRRPTRRSRSRSRSRSPHRRRRR